LIDFFLIIVIENYNNNNFSTILSIAIIIIIGIGIGPDGVIMGFYEEAEAAHSKTTELIKIAIMKRISHIGLAEATKKSCAE
jgi:hypothetical protein